jgi:hypothetical protein
MIELTHASVIAPTGRRGCGGGVAGATVPCTDVYVDERAVRGSLWCYNIIAQ